LFRSHFFAVYADLARVGTVSARASLAANRPPALINGRRVSMAGFLARESFVSSEHADTT
jgi:hypothetical protein